MAVALKNSRNGAQDKPQLLVLDVFGVVCDGATAYNCFLASYRTSDLRSAADRFLLLVDHARLDDNRTSVGSACYPVWFSPDDEIVLEHEHYNDGDQLPAYDLVPAVRWAVMGIHRHYHTTHIEQGDSLVVWI